MATTRVRATAKFVRTPANKVRQMLELIKGEHVHEARRVLQLSTKGAAKPLLKTLESAIANAENNEGLDPDELFVAGAWADEGPTIKRFQPRALGRAYRIRKRTSHITVVVSPITDRTPAGRRS
jgi:large subunit ribosomal protein L22